MRGAASAFWAAALAALAAGCLGVGEDASRPPAGASVSVPEADAPAEGVLVLVGARGALPASVLERFAQDVGCRVRVVPALGAAATEAALRARRGEIDLVAADAFAAGQIIDAGLTAPVDVDAVPGARSIAGRFRDGPAARRDGREHGLPYLWTELVLAARVDAFPDGAPLSWRGLYEPEADGQVAMLDTPELIALAARYLGANNPFALSNDELEAAETLLSLQRPLVAAYPRREAGVAGLLRSGRVTLAPATPALVRSLGTLVRFATPREGTIGWTELLLLANGAPHPVCAYRLLSYASLPSTQARIAEAREAYPVSPGACITLGPKRCRELRADDREAVGDVAFAATPREPTALAAWEQAWRRATRG